LNKNEPRVLIRGFP